MKTVTPIAVIFLVLVVIFLVIYWPGGPQPDMSGLPGNGPGVNATPSPDLSQTTPRPRSTAIPQSGNVTLNGEFICLPHKNPGDFETLECAYGFRDENGLNYVADMSPTHVSSFDLPMNQKFVVKGRFTPIEVLSTDMWMRYDVVGIISVEKYTEVASDIPNVKPDSTVTLELLKPINVSSTTIRVKAVLEDSRCPSDVVCIQAGKVVLMLLIDSPSGSSYNQISVGKTVTTETLSIRLDEVTPYPVSSRKISDDEYRFKFTINRK